MGGFTLILIDDNLCNYIKIILYKSWLPSVLLVTFIWPRYLQNFANKFRVKAFCRFLVQILRYFLTTHCNTSGSTLRQKKYFSILLPHIYIITCTTFPLNTRTNTHTRALSFDFTIESGHDCSRKYEAMLYYFYIIHITYNCTY